MSRKPDIPCNSNRPQAVAFDLDGLMFNTEALYELVGRKMIEGRGMTFSLDLVQRMMGRPSRVALQLMIDHYDLVESIAELEQETDHLFNDILDERLETMPGLLELIAALEEADIPKAVTTSSRRPFVRRVLGQFDLENRFQFILSAEDVVNGKPSPEIYQSAADRFKIPPTQLMVLEDSEVGSRAAVAANAVTISIPGDHSRHHNVSTRGNRGHQLGRPHYL